MSRASKSRLLSSTSAPAIVPVDPANEPQSGVPQRLIYSREQVGQLLGGVSVATIRRLELAGRLRPIRLSRSKAGQVFFRAEDVRAFVEGAAKAQLV